MTLRTTIFSLVSSLVLSLSIGVGLVGCSEVDEAIDCNQICNRYKDCFDANYDVSACASRCESNADNVANYADKVDACENCIDDRSCASATFGCAAECSTIVP